MSRTFPSCLTVVLPLFFCSLVQAQGFSPEEALKRMKVADGLEVKLVASEPLIRQPVTMSFDRKGRLWVLQYLQYPTPNGLKPVSVDVYLRTKYDKVPEPPPKGPKGADRITILSDPDENGRFTKSKDFVTGLNLASGMCLGHGGVYVAQPPYLLFYPDRDGDDIPDGDPEVLLKGFGMEDAHAFANSLQWGPDGWLYGAHGSTSYANIRGIEFVQGIWRYHPITKEFELFSEGGGNTWGLDFDGQGNVIAGTNFGGVAMLHQMQGAYYVKGFAKHGELKNPHAYGYFEHVPYKGFKGGHVTCGGIVYQGGALPEKFNNQYIAANLLSNAIYWHKMEKNKSTYKAEFGGDLLLANDTWFRPIDCLTGPDGAVYIADWYDKRAAHHDPRDNWDRTNGRVYKLQTKGLAGKKGDIHLFSQAKEKLALLSGEKKDECPLFYGFDLGKLSSQELVGLLTHKNDFYQREARLILAERKDNTILPVLEKMIQTNKGQPALQALWALNVSGGLTDALAEKFMSHPTEEVRTWTVRLLGDAKKVTPGQQLKMVILAATDSSPLLRSQLACTARRLPGKDGLPIVQELLSRNEDKDDPYIPLLLWWAIEQKAVSDVPEVLKLFEKKEAWHRPLVKQFITERIGRRYMAEGTEQGFKACAWLLEHASSPADVRSLVAGMDKALQGKQVANMPPVLQGPLTQIRLDQPDNLQILCFAMRLGDQTAFQHVLARAGDAKIAEKNRIYLIQALGQSGNQQCNNLLVDLFCHSTALALKQAALTALQGFNDERIPLVVMNEYPKLSGSIRSQARNMLCSRESSALQFLKAIDAAKLTSKELTIDEVRQISNFKNAAIKKLIEKHWGKIAPATKDDKLGQMRWFEIVLSRGKGEAAHGKPIFMKHCGTCHTLFGEGNKIGPDLTGADRKNLNFLMQNIVDPSAVQRLEFTNHVVVTSDGRNLSGVVSEANAEMVTLVNAKNEKTTIPRSQIEDIVPSPVSLMPEKLLDPLSDEELRHLFAYLQSDGPIKSTGTKANDNKGISPSKQPTQSKSFPLAPGGGGGSGVRGKKLTVCLVSGSEEYKSDISLAKLQKYLESNYNIQCTWAKAKGFTDLPGLENLDTCDVALFFTRRLTIKGEQLEKVKKYALSGKPIVALRTASHGFQNFLEMDKLVFGGNYKNHYKDGPVCQIKFVDKDHPILKGVKPFSSVGSLYKNPDIAKDTHLLLTGSIPEHTEPLAWTRIHNGGRLFYTSLGHQKDFEDANFLRMVANALYWTAKKMPD